jgi:hypothetical protein
MEKIFRKIEYTKKSKINLTADNVSADARAVIDGAEANESLVLRVRINSPVYIEAAAALNSEGIKSVCSVE